MGDMKEIFDVMKEYNKNKKQMNSILYTDKIIEMGAVKKSDGVYEYNDWLIYPSKNFAMDKYNNRHRVNIDTFIGIFGGK